MPAARLPGALLALLLAGAFARFLASPVAEVRLQPDDRYIAVSYLTRPAEILSSFRTYAYPFFLRGLRQVSPGYGLLPPLQAALFLAAIGYFFLALRQAGLAPWTALAAAAPLVASPLLWTYGSHVLTDCPGGAGAIAAVGAFLAVRARPSWPRVVGLASLVFLTYQLRPAYLFLVALLPVLALVLGSRREARDSPLTPALHGRTPEGRTPEGRTPEASIRGARGWDRDPLHPSRQPARRWRPALGLAAVVAGATALPFLAFSALRWAVVGEFGLVSFGGYNVIGIGASLLSPEAIEQVPPDLRPLAGKILTNRGERGLSPLPGRRFPDASAKVEAWRREYNANIWACADRPAWEEAVARYEAFSPRPGSAEWEAARPAGGPRLAADQVKALRIAWRATRRAWSSREANRLLTRLAAELLRDHPRDYAAWLVENLRFALVRTPGWVPALLPLAVALGLALIGTGVATVAGARGAAGRPQASGPASLRRERLLRGWEGALSAVAPLLWTAVGFYAAQLALVLLVEPPIERYVFAAGLFLPGTLAALAWEVFAQGRPAVERRPPDLSGARGRYIGPR